MRNSSLTVVSDSAPKRQRCGGVSLLELLIVFAMLAVITVAALPQIITSRRIVRSSAIPRQILTEMRLARQQAMTERQAFTVQYDDVNKQLIVFNHRAAGAALLDDPDYPRTAGSVQERVIALSGSGVNAPEISYGAPPLLPIAARTLDDGITMTGLTNNQLNVTFQPNGSVIDRAGNPTNTALFLYNNLAPDSAAYAVSILGAAGRVKIWSYSSSANKYAE